MEKEIALAVNFNAAPQPIKDAANAYNTVNKDLSRELVKQAESSAKIAALQIKQSEAAKVLSKLLKEWNP